MEAPVIVGMATELVAVGSLRERLEAGDEGWLAATWTPAERATCLARVDPAPGLAARLGAKRAALVALGLEAAAGDAPLLDVEVERADSGKPRLVLRGEPRRAAAALGVQVSHVSLTHLDDHALAVVMLEDGR